MRRLICIALLLLFLFNVAGYHLVFMGLRYQAGRDMNDRLDAGNYSTEETLTFKIPIAVPYYMDNTDYQRVDGAFQRNGEFFKMVKQKLERDTLYLVCIKDTSGKRIHSAMTEFEKLSGDLPVSSQQSLKLLGSFIKDYAPAATLTTQCSQPYIILHFFQPDFDLLATDKPVFSPPPDLPVLTFTV